MKKFCLLFSFLLFNFSAFSQCDIPSEFSGNTGASQTVMLTKAFISSLTINDSGSYVVATTDDGMVVGSSPVYGLDQTSLAVWGNDSSTDPVIDGALTGESINLSLVDGSSLYSLSLSTPISYSTNGLSIQAAGPNAVLCEVDVPSGDCSLPGFYDGNTGANMTVMLLPGVFDSLNIINEDAYISALSGDMLVGSINVYGVPQTAISVWGDDTSTSGITDGALTGASVTLQLVDGSSLYDLNTSSITYSTNGTAVISSASVSLSCGVTEILGCTNAAADNYNSDATTDDASCVITGCMESEADNYNASANNAGACNYSGCTNSLACNYDAIHNVEDGSCTYAASGYDCAGICLLDSDGDGVCDPFEVIGCVDSVGCNYNSDATDPGFCSYPSASYLDCDGNCNFDSDGDGICDENESTGCTNSLAINYNPAATDDDGSCIAPILGCTDSTASNYDGAANTDNGLCQYPGCTDASAFNYDEDANVNNGSCIAVVQGCTDASAFNYSASANTDDGSCEAVLEGCMVSGAINYNPNANTEGECIMPEAGFEIVNSNTGNNALIFIADTAFSLADGANLGAFFIDENGDSQCAGVVSWSTSGGNLIVVHGDDPNTADIDGAHGEIIWQTNIDGQGAILFAEYSGYGPENIVGSNQYVANAAYYISSFTLAIEGCMNPGYMEYNASANVDDGSCAVLYSVGLANAEAQIANLDSVISQLNVDLFNTQSALADSIYSYESQLVAMQAAWDQEVLDSVTWWSDKYNLDMINLQNSMQAIIDQMQSACDDEVDSLENELVILNQGLSDSIASYEGQLSDMQASWDADTLDYHNQLVALQASLDSTVADYQDQLSTLVDNHANAVSELNGQLAALQGQYDGAVASYEDSISTMHINWDNEVATLQAAWDAAVDQLTQDAADSAAAALALLNLTIDNYEIDLSNMETSYLGQISQLNSSYSDSISQILYEDVLEDAAYDSQISSLESDTLLLNSQISSLSNDVAGLTSDLAILNSNYDDLDSLQTETQESLDFYSDPIVIDLQQGWNMIGFQWQNSQDVALSFDTLGNSVHLVKDNNASVYWPEFGFNSLGTVEPGQGYQVRMYYSFPGFSFPELGENERLDVVPQVPDWVHDMVIPNHPNDTRSLVSVVNMLGQEVNPDDVFKGEVLLYLYSDGTVEKLIK